MADRDVLELENAEEFGDGGDMEMGEESISKLKDKAKRRKGRGFEGSAVSRDVSCTLLEIYHLQTYSNKYLFPFRNFLFFFLFPRNSLDASKQ